MSDDPRMDVLAEPKSKRLLEEWMEYFALCFRCCVKVEEAALRGTPSESSALELLLCT